MEESARVRDELSSPNEPHTIGEFVKQNTELIQALALFVASTVLAQIFERTIFGDFVVIILLSIAILLFLELRSHLPAGMKLPLSITDVQAYAKWSREYYELEPTHFLPWLRLFSLFLDGLVVCLVIGSIAAGGQLIADTFYVVALFSLVIRLWGFFLTLEDDNSRKEEHIEIIGAGCAAIFVAVISMTIPLYIAIEYGGLPWFPNLNAKTAILGFGAVFIVFYLKGGIPKPYSIMWKVERERDRRRRDIRRRLEAIEARRLARQEGSLEVEERQE